MLPDPVWPERAQILADLTSTTTVLDVTTAADARQICAALVSADLTAPIVVVAHAHTCQLLPAVALSLRTQHLDTCGYVLVDPDAPPATDIWPESPVTAISTDADAANISLRGWPVERASNTNLGAVVARVVGDYLAAHPPRS